MDILPNTEKQREPIQQGGWQKMARRRYQKGSIRKRGTRNPIWELLWREDCLLPDGRLQRRLSSHILGSAREMNLRQARKTAEEFLRPLNQGRCLPQSQITLQQFVDEQFIPHLLPTLKPSTRQHYLCTWRAHLLPAFGDAKLAEITPLDLQRFVLKKLDAGLGWHSADHFRNLLSKIFSTATKWGCFGGPNPAAAVELPPKQPVRELHILNPKQVKLVLEELGEPVRLMVWMSLLTGMRVGELLALRWQDLDFGMHRLHIQRTWYRGWEGTPKTRGSMRIIPVPLALGKVLLHHRSQVLRDAGSDLIFSTTTGTPMSDTNLLHRHLKPAGKKLGMPWLNWHTLRRTHATLLQNAGGSLKDAQAQLGHTKLSTTFEIYTLPIPQHQREAVENLAVLLTNDDELAQSGPGLFGPATQNQ